MIKVRVLEIIVPCLTHIYWNCLSLLPQFALQIKINCQRTKKVLITRFHEGHNFLRTNCYVTLVLKYLMKRTPIKAAS